MTKLFSLLDLCEDIYKKQYPVTDGKTQRKNVVLISMEIGAIALKTAFVFLEIRITMRDIMLG